MNRPILSLSITIVSLLAGAATAEANPYAVSDDLYQQMQPQQGRVQPYQPNIPVYQSTFTPAEFQPYIPADYTPLLESQRVRQEQLPQNPKARMSGCFFSCLILRGVKVIVRGARHATRRAREVGHFEARCLTAASPEVHCHYEKDDA